MARESHGIAGRIPPRQRGTGVRLRPSAPVCAGAGYTSGWALRVSSSRGQSTSLCLRRGGGGKHFVLDLFHLQLSTVRYPRRRCRECPDPGGRNRSLKSWRTWAPVISPHSCPQRVESGHLTCQGDRRLLAETGMSGFGHRPRNADIRRPCRAMSAFDPMRTFEAAR